MSNRNPLKIPLITLAITFISLIITGVLLNNKNFSDYLINVSVEVLGAIITVLFIDIYLNKHEKIIADKRERIAWTLLKPLMRAHYSLLFNLYKASTAKRGSNFKTIELPKFLSDDYIDTIRHLNVTLKAPVFPATTWINYLRIEFDQFNKKYDTILDKYSAHMDPDLVDVIESIRNSLFHHHMVIGLSMMDNLKRDNDNPTPQNIFGQMFTKEVIIEPYLQNLKTLISLSSNVDIMKDFLDIGDGHWRNDISPAIGSSRIN
jgi:hypothetical protein